MPRTALPHRVSPVQMLRALRDEPGLAALFGDWLHGDAVIGIRPTRVLGADEDPFAALGAADDDAALTAEDPARFGGGWLGYLGYQLSRRLETLPPAPPRSGALPEHHLAHYDHVLVHDAAADRWLSALPTGGARNGAPRRRRPGRARRARTGASRSRPP